MDLCNKKEPDVVLIRPSNNDDFNVAIRESFLSNSTSGIEKGEGASFNDTDSFSSPDIDSSSKEHWKIVDENNETKITLLDELKIKRNSSIIEVEQFNVDNTMLCKNEVSKVAIPDGGWGWIIVFASFMISTIADGISFSFGLLYIEFLDEFGASKATTAWIGSLFIAVPLLSGPIMSALVDRYGCRSMTIFGGILSCLGFVLASISTSLGMVMITFGIVAGLGLGLVYVTAVVSIAYWFDKKRNLALGLGACGTGVGTFIYAPLTQYCIEEYGWRGTILLLSGTLLNMCVFGCLMKDPEWWLIEQEQEKQVNIDAEKRKFRRLSKLSNNDDDFDDFIRGETMKKLIDDGFSADKVISDEVAFICKRHNVIKSQRFMKIRNKCKSLLYLPTYINQSERMNLSDIGNSLETNSKENQTNVKGVPSRIASENVFNETKKIQLEETISDNCIIDIHDNKRQNENAIKYFEKSKSEEKDELKKFVKQDSKDKRDGLFKQLSINHHYLKDLKMSINSISHRNAILNTTRYKLRASSCPDIFKNSMVSIDEIEEKWYTDCVACFVSILNVSLLKEVTFILLCFGTIILFIWFIVPYFYLAEHMIHDGYNEDDGAFMLSLIGITNTIGMIGLGWLGDLPQLSISNLYAFCLVFCGISVAALPLVTFNYWFLAAVSSVFGLFFAAAFIFTPSLVAKLVPLDDFTSAYGLILLAMGIGHLIGPPLTGFIYDVTLSWELCFYLAGGWIIVSGFLISFIQPIKNYKERRNII